MQRDDCSICNSGYATEKENLGELRTVIGSVINISDTEDIELAIKMLQNLLLKVRTGEYPKCKR